MAGNSQRKGAVRKRGKGVGQGNTAGSGGRIRRSLKGKGPTPKAEDRPNHKAYRTDESQQSNRGRPRKQLNQGPQWIAGRNPAIEALRADMPVLQIHVADGIDRDDRVTEIMKTAAARSIPLMSVTRNELDRLTHGAVHQGIAVQLPAYEYADALDVLDAAIGTDQTPLIVAAEGVTDPRNLGAIIRSAAAFGAHGIVIPERRAASMTAAAWKTSAGAAARVPVARVTNMNRFLEQAARAGFTIVGLAGEADVDLTEVDVTDPVVLVVGSEDTGLSRLVREHCDAVVSIPIASEVESLNASVAAGIALYEIARTRG